MPVRLFRLYQRKRIININANIIAAGLLALLPTAGIVWVARNLIESENAWLFTLISVMADICADVSIFFALHWVANHWRPIPGKTKKERAALEAKPPSFIRSASLVQFERALLSPLYYLIAASLMRFLLHHGYQAEHAVFIAFPTGLIITRIVHTIWGLRTGLFRDHEEMEHNKARTDETPVELTEDKTAP